MLLPFTLAHWDIILWLGREDLHLVDLTSMQNCQLLYFIPLTLSDACFAILFFEIMFVVTWFRRRESTDVEDLFIAHISGMDTLARGLRNVAKLIEVKWLFKLMKHHSEMYWVCFPNSRMVLSPSLSANATKASTPNSGLWSRYVHSLIDPFNYKLRDQITNLLIS